MDWTSQNKFELNVQKMNLICWVFYNMSNHRTWLYKSISLLKFYTKNRLITDKRLRYRNLAEVLKIRKTSNNLKSKKGHKSNMSCAREGRLYRSGSYKFICEILYAKIWHVASDEWWNAAYACMDAKLLKQVNLFNKKSSIG